MNQTDQIEGTRKEKRARQFHHRGGEVAGPDSDYQAHNQMPKFRKRAFSQKIGKHVYPSKEDFFAKLKLLRQKPKTVLSQETIDHYRLRPQEVLDLQALPKEEVHQILNLRSLRRLVDRYPKGFTKRSKEWRDAISDERIELPENTPNEFVLARQLARAEKKAQTRTAYTFTTDTLSDYLGGANE